MSKDTKKTFADSGKGLARHKLHVNKAGESNNSRHDDFVSGHFP